MAVKFIKDFSNQKRFVISPSASCTGMVRNSYNNLFNGSAYYLDYKRLQKSIFELSEFLTNVLKVNHIEGAELHAKAVYHNSCSALRECHIKEGPGNLLRNVKGLELLEIKDAETCCGFGGSFSIKFEPISVAMKEQRVYNAIEAGAEVIVSADSSCLMQLDG